MSIWVGASLYLSAALIYCFLRLLCLEKLGSTSLRQSTRVMRVMQFVLPHYSTPAHRPGHVAIQRSNSQQSWRNAYSNRYSLRSRMYDRTRLRTVPVRIELRLILPVQLGQLHVSIFRIR
jgi:hypothetical protein